ncbi:MAG TPA: MarR family transcriptional regulator [Dehalococcoidia bacterium]|nr:MarR family transcriptional regulator [Dehalococcoidia bacterium]
MDDKRQAEEQKFVEEVGIVLEQTGLPRMAGRILGRLLISDPPHQSMKQLVTDLMASKGSVSTMTRLLIQIGLIERLSLPGVRGDYFRLRPDAWQHMIRRGLEDEIRMVRQLAERGLELLADKTPLARKWLEEMRDVYAFLEREFPTLLQRWEEEHKRKSGR